MKKLVLPLLFVILLFWLFIDKCNHNVSEDAFAHRQDSLNNVVDSLEVNIAKRDSVIDELYKVNIELDYQIGHQQEKIKIIIKYTDSSKQKVDTYTEKELISLFNQRYPKDTITNPLPLAQPVLVAAAKDLVELDGVKEIIVVKDSIISLTEDKVVLRDSIITHFSDKEANYKSIIGIKNTQINDHKIQYESLKLENKKLKIKANLGKIGTGLAVVGLTFLLIK
jgi:uncharacterized coiled-coil protein SlyX